MTRQLWISMVCLVLSVLGGSRAFAQCTGGAWSQVAEMRLTRQAMGVAHVGDFIYVYGGLLSGDPVTPILVADALDLTTGQSNPIQFVPSARYHMAYTVLRAEPYLIGGFLGNYDPSNLVWAYDPLLDEWNRKANLPTRRAGCMAATYDDKIYVFGGVAANQVPQANVYVYSPGTNTWQAGADMPTRRTRMAIAEANGLIYLVGGYGLDGSPLAVVERYNASLDEWATLPPLNVARADAAAGIVNDKLYVFGGQNDAVVSTTEVYDISAGVWSCRKDMPVPRQALAAVPFPDRVYLLGGSEVTGIDPSTQVDTFTAPEFVATEVRSFGSFKAGFGSRRSP